LGVILTGPVIWFVRIGAISAFFMGMYGINTSDPQTGEFIIYIIFMAVVAGLWTRAEKYRGNYLREESQSKVSHSISTLPFVPLDSTSDGYLLEHKNQFERPGHKIRNTILVIAGLCTILSYFKSCTM